MSLIFPANTNHFHIPPRLQITKPRNGVLMSSRGNTVVRGSSGGQDHEKQTERRRRRSSFLSLEEAGLVEISGLSSHEKFLCRLTISSLNLLRVVAEQEGCSIEELNGGKVCDWFVKDKVKREQSIGSAVLQWDDDDDDAQFPAL